jgi:hypothetical protein
MKNSVIFFVFVLLGLSVFGQSTHQGNYHLTVRGGLQDRTLEFKPGKRLKLTTTTGEIIYTRQYAIFENHIIAENNNFVNFEDIARIKGRVMNDSGRVGAGVLVTGSGMILLGGTIAIATLALTPGLTLLLTGIEAGIIVGGVKIMGHRTFRTNKGWEIQTYLAGE